MSLDTGAVDIVYYDLTGTAVADCDVSDALLPEPESTDTSHIDNGFTIEVEVAGTFNAIVPVISTFIDGIDLTSSQTRSIFMGVVGE
jgi:hypothetical protein